MSYGAYFKNDDGVIVLGTDLTAYKVAMMGTASNGSTPFDDSSFGVRMRAYRPYVTGGYSGQSFNFGDNTSSTGTFEGVSLTSDAMASAGSMGVLFYDASGNITFDSNRRLPRFLKWADVTSAATPGAAAVNVTITKTKPVGSKRFAMLVFNAFDCWQAGSYMFSAMYYPKVVFNSDLSFSVVGQWSSTPTVDPYRGYYNPPPYWQLLILDV